jgi:hypothetical protein
MNKAILVLIPVILGWPLPVAAQGEQAATIAKILNARSLWGKDFPAAIASLPAWDRFDERRIVIMRDRMVGGTPFKSAETVQALVGSVRDAMTQAAPTPTGPFASLLSDYVNRPAPLQTQVVRLADDGSQRLTVTAPNYQFLPATLTTKQVEEVAGPPEKLTTEVLQTEGDRRPVTLTLRSYGGGAIVYAESDWAPTPGIVDRVILDVPAVASTVFQGRR